MASPAPAVDCDSRLLDCDSPSGWVAHPFIVGGGGVTATPLRRHLPLPSSGGWAVRWRPLSCLVTLLLCVCNFWPSNRLRVECFSILVIAGIKQFPKGFVIFEF